jgi:4-azaleucine resistance transporter AzlC
VGDADRSLRRDVGAIALASAAVGVSFGAIGVAAGVPPWLTVLMSVIIFAGGAQFLAVGLLAAGNPFAAVFAGLLLNARHLPFGMALGSTLDGPWARKLLGAHLMIDESVAFALARPDGPERRRAYWLTGGALFVCWNLGALLGVVLGSVVGDTDRLGLDAAFPAGLFALILPQLRDRETRVVALAGAAVAVAVTPLLPAGLPVLLSLSALGLVPLTRRLRRPDVEARS